MVVDVNKNLKRLDMLKLLPNLKNTIYVDKEIQDIMKEFYQIQEIL